MDCPKCGKNLILVGKAHDCRPHSSPFATESDSGWSVHVYPTVVVDDLPKSLRPYKDPEKRRKQIREAVRRHREK
jgi:hypothetical protein